MSNGIWTKQDAEHHQVSEKIAKWLANYLPIDKPVFDFGCGNGYYMKYLEEEGFEAIGIDGNSNIQVLCKNFIKYDISDPIKLSWKGSVITFETLEHIPKDKENIAVDNIVNACNGILIVSWASVGQPGIGHVNCQDKEYVVSLFESKGFELQEIDTMDARANVDKNCDWLERNLLVFKRK
jgi:SAM-dependent methyltransferase